jgi:hypothetical protein
MNNKLENFENEFQKEIASLKSLEFAKTISPEFQIPSYKILNTKIISFVLAMPAIAVFFGFFFYNSQSSVYTNEIAMLEDSNQRLSLQIDTLSE